MALAQFDPGARLKAVNPRARVSGMMGHREKLAGDGFHSFARFWRRNVHYRPGEVAKVKRRYAKKARKAARLAVHQAAEA